MAELSELYKRYKFPGVNKLWELAKKEKLRVKFKDVKKFISSQRVSQLYKPKPKLKYLPIVTATPDTDFQMDLLDMQNFYHSNSHYRYILLVVDIFSRKAYAEPLKKKTPEEVLRGLKKIFEVSGIPSIMASDNGTEYKGVVSKYFKENKIVHRENEVGDHQVLGVIDRLARTIKNKIYQNFTAEDNTKWLQPLKDIISTYNDTPHSRLDNMTPNEAHKFSSDTRTIHYEKVKEALDRREFFQKGDHVRVLLKKKSFQRGFERKWTLQTYKVDEIEGRNYILSNGKKYRAHQLQKVGIEDKGNRDEVRKEKRKHKQEQLLKREGIDDRNILQPTPSVPSPENIEGKKIENLLANFFVNNNKKDDTEKLQNLIGSLF